jgi:hypothetical protein
MVANPVRTTCARCGLDHYGAVKKGHAWFLGHTTEAHGTPSSRTIAEIRCRYAGRLAAFEEYVLSRQAA